MDTNQTDFTKDFAKLTTSGAREETATAARTSRDGSKAVVFTRAA